MLHSLDKFAGGVENRTSQLELNFPSWIESEFLLFKDIITLPHKGKVNIIKSLKIPKFVIKNKNRFKLLAYFYGFILFFYRVYKVKKFLNKNKFDVVLAVDDYFGLIGCLVSKNLVVSIRNYWEKMYNNSQTHLIPDFIYKKVYPYLLLNKKIHTVSKCLQQYLKNQYNLNSQAIYNIFNIKKIKKLATEEIEFDFEYFINIGHLNEQKNQKDLILAYNILKQNGIQEKLIIIGDGKNKNDLQYVIKSLNLENDIFLIGKQSNPYKYLKKAKLYISTSLYEGFPAVFVESNILKIPIISYDFMCGAKELAIYLSKNNPQDLAKMILNLKDKSLQIKNIDVSKENIIYKWENLLKEASV